MTSTGRLIIIALLALIGPLASAQAAPLAPPPPPDTNIYVQPPTTTGRVKYDVPFRTYAKSSGDLVYGGSSRYYIYHSYLSFGLAEFPDSATVISVRLWYYQYDHYSDYGYLPATDVVLVPDVSVPAQQLFEDIENGPIAAPAASAGDGWVVRSFNGDGVTAVDSCILSGDPIEIGIRAVQYNARGSAYGAGPFDPFRAYLEIRCSTTASYSDMVAVDAFLESSLVHERDSVPVTGRFTNTGNSTARNFNVYTSCDGVIEDSVCLDSAAPGETVHVHAMLPPAGQPKSVKLMLWARLFSDWCPHNDTVSIKSYVYPGNALNAESFEVGQTPSFPPVGWRTVNGGDTSTWRRAGLGDRNAHSGDYYAKGSGTEDWLITYGLGPTAAAPDTVGFFLAAPYGVCATQVWALRSQNKNDAFGLLLDTTVQSSSWCQKRISIDQYDGCTVYIGFRVHRPDGGPTCLDDIWSTSERATAVGEMPDASPRLFSLELGANPVTTRLLLVRYQIPQAGPLTVTASDIVGRTFRRLRLVSTATDGEFKIDTGSWPAGVYIIRAMTTSATSFKKFILQ